MAAQVGQVSPLVTSQPARIVNFNEWIASHSKSGLEYFFDMAASLTSATPFATRGSAASVLGCAADVELPPVGAAIQLAGREE